MAGPGRWSFEVEPNFRLLDGGSSVQAVAGDRIVYLSSMRVDAAVGAPSAVELRRTAARTLQSTERFEHSTDGLQGEAEVRLEGEGFALHGFMCAAGTVATCVISFNQCTEIAWAESVWRSIRHNT